jgi:hypothetical protein
MTRRRRGRACLPKNQHAGRICSLTPLSNPTTTYTRSDFQVHEGLFTFHNDKMNVSAYPQDKSIISPTVKRGQTSGLRHYQHASRRVTAVLLPCRHIAQGRYHVGRDKPRVLSVTAIVIVRICCVELGVIDNYRNTTCGNGGGGLSAEICTRI